MQQDDGRLRRVPGLAVEESKARTAAVLKYIIKRLSLDCWRLSLPAKSASSPPSMSR